MNFVILYLNRGIRKNKNFNLSNYRRRVVISVVYWLFERRCRRSNIVTRWSNHGPSCLTTLIIYYKMKCFPLKCLFLFAFAYFRISICHRILKDQMTIGNKFSWMSISTRYLIQFCLYIIKTNWCFYYSFIILKNFIDHNWIR